MDWHQRTRLYCCAVESGCRGCRGAAGGQVFPRRHHVTSSATSGQEAPVTPAHCERCQTVCSFFFHISHHLGLHLETVPQISRSIRVRHFEHNEFTFSSSCAGRAGPAVSAGLHVKGERYREYTWLCRKELCQRIRKFLMQHILVAEPSRCTGPEAYLKVAEICSMMDDGGVLQHLL